MIFRLYLLSFFYQFDLRLQQWKCEIPVRNFSAISTQALAKDFSFSAHQLLVYHLYTVFYISLDKKYLAEIKQTDEQLWSTQMFTEDLQYFGVNVMFLLDFLSIRNYCAVLSERFFLQFAVEGFLIQSSRCSRFQENFSKTNSIFLTALNG
jgi:hypothetical protein